MSRRPRTSRPPRAVVVALLVVALVVLGPGRVLAQAAAAGDPPEEDATTDAETRDRVGATEPDGDDPTDPTTGLADEGSDAPDEELGDDPPAANEIRYELERVRIVGNDATSRHVIRGFVPLGPGDVLDVDDPMLEAIRWRLLGTGWFDRVEMSLERGSMRGLVTLVIRVSERNTLVLRRLVFGVSQGLSGTSDETPDLQPYLGLSIAERNLFGQGLTLGATTLVSAPQWGVNVDFADPTFLGSRYAMHVSGFVNDANEFFGNDPLVAGPPGDPDFIAENAVVTYRRFGLSVGTGVDVGRFTRAGVDLQTELVDVDNIPAAASEVRGDEVVPIDFSILDGRSVVSMLRFRLRYDHRDDPVLPTRGTAVDISADLGNRVFGSSYDFLRLQGALSQSIPLPGRTSLRIGVYGGFVFGDAPFFLQFYIADLTDLIPSRVLEMNIDRRPAPNLLGTSISEQRIGDVAGRFDLEYTIPLLRQALGPVRAIDAYFGAGIYALARREDLRVAIAGFDGASRIPADLTFDLGLRIDTDVGLIELGLSTVLGFVDP